MMKNELRLYNLYLLEKCSLITNKSRIKDFNDNDFDNAIIFLDLYNYHANEEELGYTDEVFEKNIRSFYKTLCKKIFILSYECYIRKLKLEKLKSLE